MSPTFTFNNKNFSDVVFIFSDGGKLYAHRAVLACASPYFEAMFLNGCMLESRNVQQDEKIEFQVEDYSVSIYEEMLKFCYGIEINLDMSNISQIVEVAQMYQIESLLADCISYAKVSKWVLDDLILLCCKSFVAKSDVFLAHLGEIILTKYSYSYRLLEKNKSLLPLDEEVLIIFLQSSPFQSLQHQAFYLLMCWAKVQVEEQRITSIAEALQNCMKHIDFSKMKSFQLYTCVSPFIDILPDSIALDAFNALMEIKRKHFTEGIPIDGQTLFCLKSGEKAYLNDQGGLMHYNRRVRVNLVGREDYIFRR